MSLGKPIGRHKRPQAERWKQVAEEEDSLRARATVIALLLLLAVVGVSSSRQVAADTQESWTGPFPLDRPYLTYYPDDWNLARYPNWTEIGDEVTGTREISITKISIIDIDLKLSWNTASDMIGRQFVFEVSLNGIVVGYLDIFGYNGLSRTQTYTFSPIVAMGPVVVRYKLVDRDGGKIIMIADGSSTITLRDGLATKKDWANEALAKLNPLYYDVDQSGIDQGPRHSLLSKLDRAIEKIDQALVYIEKGNDERANNKLRIALNAVESFSERIPPGYEYWQSDAVEIAMLIETAIKTPI